MTSFISKVMNRKEKIRNEIEIIACRNLGKKLGNAKMLTDSIMESIEPLLDEPERSEPVTIVKYCPNCGCTKFIKEDFQCRNYRICKDCKKVFYPYELLPQPPKKK